MGVIVLEQQDVAEAELVNPIVDFLKSRNKVYHVTDSYKHFVADGSTIIFTHADEYNDKILDDLPTYIQHKSTIILVMKSLDNLHPLFRQIVNFASADKIRYGG